MIPGPSAAELIPGLVAFAVSVAVIGEAVRVIAARWIAAWRELEALERLLLDFFLGGAALYLLAVLPLGLFSPTVLVAVGGLAAAGVTARLLLRVRRRALGSLASLVRPLLTLPALLTLVAALAVLVFEVLVASPVGTGNTFDSSLLTLYTARLLDAHQVPLSFLPYANVGLLYPQGATVWFGSSELFLGLPGARTSLLATPLFFALAPVGGYVLGRRLLGSSRAGAAFALTVAFVASWTRVLVGGSNDFVIAFPLVLLLAGQTSTWLREVPSTGEAVGLGTLAGYSAAINPVGMEWLFPALLIAALVSRPRGAGDLARWFVRWGATLGTALVVLTPTWYVLAQGVHSPEFVPGSGVPAQGVAGGITGSQFVGLVDPYLFRPTDVWLSPVAALRLEMAILLTLGAGLLLLFPSSAVARYVGRFRTFFLSTFVVLLAYLGVALVAGAGFRPAVEVMYLTSASELSIWVFAWYGFVAALPLAFAFEWTAALTSKRGAEAGATPPSPPAPRRAPRPRTAVLAPIAIALVILLPGVALTPTQLPGALTTLYDDFGNVTADDFAMLTYLGSHLPPGARVLVAPGSAAEFLPAYASDVVIVYPMVPGWTGINASYSFVVRELTNDTLDGAGTAALRVLNLGFIAVTGPSTTLWPPFSPGPLLNDSAEFPVLFHQGAAYVFGDALG